MGCLLNFFLFIFIFVAIQGIRLWWVVRKALHGQGSAGSARGKQQEQPRYRGAGVYRDPSAQSKQSTSGGQQRKKVYGDDEGEYVEFEEVKD